MDTSLPRLWRNLGMSRWVAIAFTAAFVTVPFTVLWAFQTVAKLPCPIIWSSTHPEIVSPARKEPIMGAIDRQLQQNTVILMLLPGVPFNIVNVHTDWYPWYAKKQWRVSMQDLHKFVSLHYFLRFFLQAAYKHEDRQRQIEWARNEEKDSLMHEVWRR